MIKNKYIQQCTRGIFVGFSEDSSGWLFYVPNARKTYILLDAIFDKNFTSSLSMPDLPFQGALKVKSINMQIPNTETLTEITGPPTGENEIYPEDLTKENLSSEMTVDKDS